MLVRTNTKIELVKLQYHMKFFTDTVITSTTVIDSWHSGLTGNRESIKVF